VVTGFGVAPLLGAYAGTGRGVDVSGQKFLGNNQTNTLDAQIGDTITWRIIDGTHTVTPYDEKAWGQKGSGDLDSTTDPQYSANHFDKPGQYLYYCKYHGGGTKDKPTGMFGIIRVADPNATTSSSSTTTSTTPPATQPTTDTTPHPAAPTTTTTTAPAPAGPAGIHPPGTAAPAPTTTATTKPDKTKSPKDSSTTTATPPPPGPINLPDSAIIPVLPSGSVQNGAVEAPGAAPQGDAVALLKQKHSHKGRLVLVAMGVGIGALGIGAVGYKFAHRSSQYFPA
jgi:plastocyanin